MSDALNVLKARRAEIARELERLRREDQELAAVETVLDRYAEGEFVLHSERMVPAARSTPKSQREMVLAVLEDCIPPWVSSGDLVREARSRWGLEVDIKSLRPLLSVMKNENLIARAGRQLALKRRAREQEPKGARRRGAGRS